MRKKTDDSYQSRLNVWIVAHQFSHRRAAVYAAGRLSFQWHAAADEITHQSNGEVWWETYINLKVFKAERLIRKFFGERLKCQNFKYATTKLQEDIQ